ncbi:hypothetical protein N657DRAFT_637277 [Parathielavia appendiculata]|uniref:Uncharacterized protein n=1 Tax=Parathielavia appendiculata TaxID=2587402 RepID=A0AAN6YZ47_9PEZI|nr:hypothetical protein N657DRAFT_637277 [Parathielavia appendiculata]
MHIGASFDQLYVDACKRLVASVGGGVDVTSIAALVDITDLKHFLEELISHMPAFCQYRKGQQSLFRLDAGIANLEGLEREDFGDFWRLTTSCTVWLEEQVQDGVPLWILAIDPGSSIQEEPSDRPPVRTISPLGPHIRQLVWQHEVYFGLRQEDDTHERDPPISAAGVDICAGIQEGFYGGDVEVAYGDGQRGFPRFPRAPSRAIRLGRESFCRQAGAQTLGRWGYRRLSLQKSMLQTCNSEMWGSIAIEVVIIFVVSQEFSILEDAQVDIGTEVNQPEGVPEAAETSSLPQRCDLERLETSRDPGLQVDAGSAGKQQGDRRLPVSVSKGTTECGKAFLVWFVDVQV